MDRCPQCQTPMVIDECVPCAERESIDRMAAEITRLMEKFSALDTRVYLEGRESAATWADTYQTLLDWNDVWYTMRFTNVNVTDAEATVLRESKKAFDETRRLFTSVQAALPTQRRNLRVVPPPKSG